MRAPTNELRQEVALAIDALQTESDLNVILDRIETEVLKEEPGDVQSEADAYDELGAIEAWASLASDAVIALYAPGSLNLLRRKGHDLAGWSQGAVQRLRKIASALRDKLGQVAVVLRGVGFSVGVNFPWGISIGLSWAIV
jgi:hypothetical protein